MTTLATTRSTARPATGPASGRVTWGAGIATGLVAAAVVTALAAVLSASGHALTLSDGAIPVIGFAQFVLAGALVGIVLARHTSRRAFYRTTIALTALSVIPSIALGATAADKLGLVLTHVVAAAIIVPRLARR